MDTPSTQAGSSRRRRWLITATLLAVLALVAAGALWLSMPRIVDHVVDERIADLEARTGLQIDVGNFETIGREAIAVDDLVITYDEDQAPLLAIAKIDATIDLLEAARGRPAIGSVTVTDVRAAIHRYADGSTSLARIAKSDDAPENQEPEPPGDIEEALEGLTDRGLAYFGGAFPDLEVIDASLNFSADEGTPPWPVTELSTDRLVIEGGEEAAPFDTVVAVTADDHEIWTLPQTLTIAGTLHRPVLDTVVRVDFDRPLQLAAVPRLPYSQAALAGFEIAEAHRLILRQPALASVMAGDTAPLAGADEIAVKLAQWPTEAKLPTIVELAVDSPSLFVNYQANGASNLSQLHQLLRQPVAHHVVDQARQNAAAIDRARRAADANDDDDRADPIAPDDDASGNDPLSRLQSRLDELPLQQWLTSLFPRRTSVTDLRVVVDDARDHEILNRPAPHFEIAADTVELNHSSLRGVLEGALKFEIIAGDDRSSTDIEFKIPYRRGDWEAAVDVDALELTQFSQLFGPRVSRYLHGGQITATLDASNVGDDGGAITNFEGLFAMRDLRVDLPAIAEDPIDVASASLFASGAYEPNLEVPDPDLIYRGYSVYDPDDPDNPSDDDDGSDDTGDDSDDDKPFDFDPPAQGAFIIDDGHVQLGDVESDYTFAIYGIDKLRRPNRLALSVDLEPTPLADLIAAVPAAIRGPLDGLALAGDLSWDYHLEIPLYEASTMAWDTEVLLSDDFEILHIPDAVDVRKLTDEFELTITDEWSADVRWVERDFTYERTVTIPAMKPTPTQWILDNTATDLETLDDARRDREWPEVPTWTPELAMSQDELDSPEYWLSDHARQQATVDPPWDDGSEAEEESDLIDSFLARFNDDDSSDAEASDEDAAEAAELAAAADDDWRIYREPDPLPAYRTEVTIDPDRYGPYVYVPLEHISPYMVRAILTTEDTSFFSHNGFNLLAIRHAVEANLEAGRYVRGASTISMQLVKNVFLDRERVLSRKLREVALVWLMESVADIPKTRLMEVYLNVIEFGPGIFGIHEAALHYFGKRPSALTIPEVAWLVSIVPNPKRYHQYYDRGEITAGWFRRMSRYMQAMHNRERITEEELEAATETIPAFHLPEEGGPQIRDDAHLAIVPASPVNFGDDSDDAEGHAEDDLGGGDDSDPLWNR